MKISAKKYSRVHPADIEHVLAGINAETCADLVKALYGVDSLLYTHRNGQVYISRPGCGVQSNNPELIPVAVGMTPEALLPAIRKSDSSLFAQLCRVTPNTATQPIPEEELREEEREFLKELSTFPRFSVLTFHCPALEYSWMFQNPRTLCLSRNPWSKNAVFFENSFLGKNNAPQVSQFLESLLKNPKLADIVRTFMLDSLSEHEDSVNQIVAPVTYGYESRNFLAEEDCERQAINGILDGVSRDKSVVKIRTGIAGGKQNLISLSLTEPSPYPEADKRLFRIAYSATKLADPQSAAQAEETIRKEWYPLLQKLWSTSSQVFLKEDGPASRLCKEWFEHGKTTFERKIEVGVAEVCLAIHTAEGTPADYPGPYTFEAAPKGNRVVVRGMRRKLLPVQLVFKDKKPRLITVCQHEWFPATDEQARALFQSIEKEVIPPLESAFPNFKNLRVDISDDSLVVASTSCSGDTRSHVFNRMGIKELFKENSLDYSADTLSALTLAALRWLFQKELLSQGASSLPADFSSPLYYAIFSALCKVEYDGSLKTHLLEDIYSGLRHYRKQALKKTLNGFLNAEDFVSQTGLHLGPLVTKKEYKTSQYNYVIHFPTDLLIRIVAILEPRKENDDDFPLFEESYQTRYMDALLATVSTPEQVMRILNLLSYMPPTYRRSFQKEHGSELLSLLTDPNDRIVAETALEL